MIICSSLLNLLRLLILLVALSIYLRLMTLLRLIVMCKALLCLTTMLRLIIMCKIALRLATLTRQIMLRLTVAIALIPSIVITLINHPNHRNYRNHRNHPNHPNHRNHPQSSQSDSSLRADSVTQDAAAFADYIQVGQLQQLHRAEQPNASGKNRLLTDIPADQKSHQDEQRRIMRDNDMLRQYLIRG